MLSQEVLMEPLAIIQGIYLTAHFADMSTLNNLGSAMHTEANPSL